MVGLKFFKRNLFACLQEVTSSLRLFNVASSGLLMMKYFSHRHKLQRFETGLKGVVCFKIFQLISNFNFAVIYAVIYIYIYIYICLNL